MKQTRARRILSQYYDGRYFERNRTWSRTPRYIHELTDFLDLLDVAPGHRVLDVGCGTGSAMEVLRQRSGASVVGIDPSADLIRELVGDKDILRGDAMDIPFPDNTFDRASMLHVIGHVTSARRTLAEIRRVLRPGGVVGIITPNRWFVWAHRPLNWLGLIPYSPDLTVLRYYTRMGMRKELTASGLNLLDCFYYGNTPAFSPAGGLKFLRERIFAFASKPSL